MAKGFEDPFIQKKYKQVANGHPKKTHKNLSHLRNANQNQKGILFMSSEITVILKIDINKSWQG